MPDNGRSTSVAPYRQPISLTQAAAIDDGLRAHMLHVYNYMVLGLAITGFAALGIYLLAVTDEPELAATVLADWREVPVRVSDDLYLAPFGQLIVETPLKWFLIGTPLALVLGLGLGVERMPPATARVLFLVYSALVGISLGALFLAFAETSVVRVFFITAAAFGALSLWGYTTDRDLTGFGSFLVMGLIGITITFLANLALGGDATLFLVSVVGVLVFAGLTAWDTQRLRNDYIYSALDAERGERDAIMGALSLYLNFINLFAFLLTLFGQREK
jgi:FtsH-binding integral membrane protein